MFSSRLGQVIPHSIGAGTAQLFASSHHPPSLAVWILLLETDRPRGPLSSTVTALITQAPRADSISNWRGHDPDINTGDNFSDNSRLPVSQHETILRQACDCLHQAPCFVL